MSNFKTGFIRRIRLENFMTYNEIELFPGSNVNLIIGPNGSGKSTFVAAIILGLGGNLEDVDKGKKYHDFIKKNEQCAKIEIELFNENKENIIIRSELSRRENGMRRYIDDCGATKDEILKYTKSLNIQVGNLCQVLPQTKVHNFITLSSEQLLTSTISAAFSPDRVNLRNELVCLKDMHKNLDADIIRMRKSLTEKGNEIERYQPQIKNFEEKQKLQDEYDICERKKQWLKYLDTEKEIKTCEKVVSDNNCSVKRCEQDMKQLQDKTNDLTNQITAMEKRRTDIKTKITQLEKNMDKTKECIDVKKRKFAEIENEFGIKLAELENRQAKLSTVDVQLDFYRNNKSQFTEVNGDESKLLSEKKSVNIHLDTTNAGIRQLKDEVMNIDSEINLHQKRLDRLKNMKQRSMDALRNSHLDVYNAIEWLRKNRNMFKYPIYEPMMLEIEFTDQNMARYLENTVSNRDLLAFTFEDDTDMKLFLKKVRIEKGFKQVSAICSPPGALPQPDDIKKIRHLGFSTYVSQTFKAPDAIQKYLREMYRIHRIPIGDRHTYQNNEHVPKEISFYFADNYSFSVKTSSYSGRTSKSVATIRQARLLANITNEDELRRTQNTITSNLNLLEQKRGYINTLNGQIDEYMKMIREIDDKIKQLQNIDRSIMKLERHKNQIESSLNINVNEERALCEQKYKGIVIEQCGLQKEMFKNFKTLQIYFLCCKGIEDPIKLLNDEKATASSQLRHFETQLTDKKRLLEESISNLHKINDDFLKKSRYLKNKFNGRIPTMSDFPDNLPSDLQTLRGYQCELEVRKNSIRLDENLLKYCNKLQEEIEELERNISIKEEELKQYQADINSNKDIYLRNLDNMTEVLNVRFAEMMEKLNFAGEVLLNTPEDKDDLSKYGIKIRVTFRPGAPLADLSRQQSGGERALSTALYLLALQSVATVPFRCLDEINQGVDENNEQKLMKLLIDVTTEKRDCQYFLLTPKLLKGLEYNEYTKIHTVMKGNYVVDYREWDYDAFLREATTRRDLS